MKKILIVILISTQGCVYPPTGKIEVHQMAKELQFKGFSIKKPSEKNWYANSDEQYPQRALFRIEIDDFSHTAYVSIEMDKMPENFLTKEQFEAYVKNDFTSFNPRGDIIEFESSQSKMQGQWRINFSLKAWDNSANNSELPLIMTMKGFVVRHPNWPRATIVAYISQRGKVSELNPEIDKTRSRFY